MSPHTGKILSVCLSSRTWDIICPDDSVYETYLGGRGLCGWLLSKYFYNDPIIFCTGPLTGSGYQTTARCAVMHKDTMTGGLFRSDFGGKFATSLKKAGYDGLLIKGKSSDAVHLVIGETVSFEEKAPEGFSIVKAGANRDILYCGIIADGFFKTHRGSTGTLMHSMNLLSVSVKTADEPEAPHTGAYEDIERLINASPSLTGRLGIGRFGTAALYDLAHARDLLPSGFFGLPKPDAKHNAGAFGETESVSCGSCTIACRKKKNGLRIPEYDEMAMLLSIGVPFEKITEIYNHCLNEGIDIITACHCIAESGTKIPAAELLKNLPKEFGQGISKLSVKGVPLPSFAPQGAQGTALGYATSPNGADWTTAMAITHEILRKPVPTDRHTAMGKAVINVAYENAKAAADSLPVCRYALFSVSLEEFAKTLDTTAARLSECGNTIFMNETELIRRMGFTPADDRLPEGLLTPQQQAEFDAELKKYHRIRGIL
ncbi:aldehyde ferredoxin oxidoreductase C-terminal domain-containing protein [Seleniivibrio woodruffii]|uniref:aldehyde ferredoxin oxidoreductase C-terminal domain-containing protein n=1 Tax=Seleniivibrio woodruffii TaxID=1078050 RepID=UPI0024098C0E|nr:aldehyde ferredoxin oxidoreductase C-terminal domain-containing protein [Seleniivibrio woodruffii]